MNERNVQNAVRGLGEDLSCAGGCFIGFLVWVVTSMFLGMAIGWVFGMDAVTDDQGRISLWVYVLCLVLAVAVGAAVLWWAIATEPARDARRQEALRRAIEEAECLILGLQGDGWSTPKIRGELLRRGWDINAIDSLRWPVTAQSMRNDQMAETAEGPYARPSASLSASGREGGRTGRSARPYCGAAGLRRGCAMTLGCDGRSRRTPRQRRPTLRASTARHHSGER